MPVIYRHVDRIDAGAEAPIDEPFSLSTAGTSCEVARSDALPYAEGSWQGRLDENPVDRSTSLFEDTGRCDYRPRRAAPFWWGAAWRRGIADGALTPATDERFDRYPNLFACPDIRGLYKNLPDLGAYNRLTVNTNDGPSSRFDPPGPLSQTD